MQHAHDPDSTGMAQQYQALRVQKALAHLLPNPFPRPACPAYKGLALHRATYIAPVYVRTGSQLTPAQTRLSPAALTDPSQVSADRHVENSHNGTGLSHPPPQALLQRPMG